MSAVLFTKAYPFAKRAVAVHCAAFAGSLRAAGFEPQDMEQEILVGLYRALGQFDPHRAALRTFVDRVIASKAISFIRRAALEMRCRKAEFQIPDGTYTININLSITIQRAVAQLPPFDGRIARLLLDDYRPTEIARELKVSRSAVYRGMNRIRDVLRQHGL